MREDRETWASVVWAVVLHALLFALFFVGGLFHREPETLSVAGGSIEAVLVDMPMPASAAKPNRPVPAKIEPKETAPKPQPKPEPKPQDSPIPQQAAPQAPIPKPDVVDQEKIDENALKKAEELKKVQEEKRRQEQVVLDEQKRLEAERKQRLAQQEEERNKQLADIRRQREAAERERKLAEEKLQQLADARKAAAPVPMNNQPLSDRSGNQGVSDGLLDRYKLVLSQQIDSNWLRPDNLPEGVKCLVRVTQMVGGQVTGVDFSQCPYDELGKRSVEAALRREPLPYRGYESVFIRELDIPFCYPDDARACRQ